MKKNIYTPIISYIGLILFAVTLVVNMSVRFRISSDPGIGILLSLLNALLLLITMAWSLLGIYEFFQIIKLNKAIRSRFIAGDLSKEEYTSLLKTMEISFWFNVSYLVIILIQIVYVIINWKTKMEI